MEAQQAIGVGLRTDRLQMRALSSEQKSTAGRSWQMSHWLTSPPLLSSTRSCLAASLFAPCTLEAVTGNATSGRQLLGSLLRSAPRPHIACLRAQLPVEVLSKIMEPYAASRHSTDGWGRCLPATQLLWGGFCASAQRTPFTGKVAPCQSLIVP